MNRVQGPKSDPKSHGDKSALATLGLSPSDNPEDNDVIAGQIDTIGRLWPVIALILAIGLIPGIVTERQSPSYIAIAVATVLIPLICCFFHKKKLLNRLSPVGRNWVYASSGVLLGAFVGLAGLNIGQDARLDTGVIALCCAVIVAMVGLSRLQSVALFFSLGLMTTLVTLGGPVILLGVIVPLLICHFMIAIALSRAEFAKVYRRIKAENDAQRSNRLLTEFEATGSSWFWETDENGRIQYISSKFLQSVGLNNSDLQGFPLISVVTSGTVSPDGLPLGERTLAFHLSSRTAFTEIPVRVAADENKRWWSMTGRPMVDRHGQFRGFIGTGSDMTAQRNSDAEATRLARSDALTGLGNRAEAGRLLAKALDSRTGEIREAALFLIDLDRFKDVNDTLGHLAGDELLKDVAKRLVSVAGRDSQVCRPGGDEFYVILPQIADPNRLAAIAKAIIVELSRNYTIQGTPVSIGASIGIATSPVNGKSAEELIRNADLALYAAKAAGRGVYRFYEPEMHSLAKKRREMEDDMRVALREGQFHLVYQPVVGLREEKLSGFEALIRWIHPVRGVISPVEFIPIAEETGLIEPIGEWVLRTACLEAASWAIPARVAVNVSAIQFANPNFTELVANALAQSGLHPNRLELEITESVFVEDDAATSHQFEMLKRLNIRLALDDFGTGYSSLGYLKKAPFDKIKIDQSFVRGATLNGSRNVAIIKAIVSLADSLGMETTAEGAETQDEIVFIRELGCSHIQGFVYGPPVKAEEVRRRLGTYDAKAQAVGHKKTRSPRQSMLRTATIHYDGAVHHVRIRNISTTGVNVEMDSEIPAHAVVQIEIADGPVLFGNVRWMKDGRTGIQFDEPLNLSLLNAPVRRLG